MTEILLSDLNFSFFTSNFTPKYATVQKAWLVQVNGWHWICNIQIVMGHWVHAL